MPGLLRISEACSLAVHGLGVLAAEPGQAMTATEVALLLNVSEAHLAKVFQRLARLGVLKSSRGPKGGFRLANPASETTLLSVFEAIEGPIAREECLMSFPACEIAKCVIGMLVFEITELAARRLGAATVADLAPLYRNVKMSTGMRERAMPEPVGGRK